MTTATAGKTRLILALTITVVLWASAFVAIRTAVRHFTPGHLAMLRFLTASLTLGCYACVQRIRLPRLRDVPVFLIAGAIGLAGYHSLLNYGEQRVSAGSAALLISTAPIWTSILATLFLKERLRIWAWVGIAMSFIGVTLIATGNGSGVHLEPEALCIAGAAFCGACYVIMQKRFLAGYGALEFTCWAFFAAAIELSVVFAPGCWTELAAAPLRARMEVLYLGVFPGALAYLTFAYAARRMPASAVTSFMYFVPVITMVIAWLYVSELPSLLALLGGALAIGGVVIVNRLGKRV